jgi:nanoRNase/pAp phosphatase (c-di-AMP/oligoRNAs hydrolase)
VNDAARRGSYEREGINLKLSEYLQAHRGENHIVVLQDYPDPDGISCAFAYQAIASCFDISSSIFYGGKVSHQQNVTLVQLVDIQLKAYSGEEDLSLYNGAVFLDNQGTTAGRIVQALEEAQIPPLIIIDHHEPQDRLKAEFVDIRRVGATATIFAEYLEAGLIEMDKDQKRHVLLATALLLGIMTDTGNFVRARDDDLSAAAYYSRFSDSNLLNHIFNQSRSKQVMSVIHKALENRITTESFSISGVGYLRGEDRDVIPQAADFLLTEENIHTVIVYGIVMINDLEERVIGSMRTNKLSIDPDMFIKDMFGKDAKGHYFGGGKLSAGGFEIPVGFLSGGAVEEYQDIKWKVYDNQIKQKIFAKIKFQP